MRKVFEWVLSLCLLGACLGISTATAESDRELTVMVYLCGTDLESGGGAATADLIEMSEAGLDPENGKVAVIVETGGTKEWLASDMINAEVNQRWAVGADNLYPLESDLGYRDMGDSETLADFIAYCMESQPAKRYMLILWDHGGGPNLGVCYDEYSQDALTMSELSYALDIGLNGKTLDMIGFDACLMGSVEIVRMLSPYTAYTIFSEELEPGTGWAYDIWLSALNDDPQMSTEELGEIIVSAYIDSVDPNDPCTLSMVDTAKLDDVENALDQLGVALGGQLNDGKLRDISRARRGMRDFGSYGDDDHTDLVDLGALCKAYEKLLPDETADLQAALQNAVVINGHTEAIDQVSGLSVFAPYYLAEYSQILDSYETFDFLINYQEFIRAYSTALSGGSYTFTASTPQSIMQIQDTSAGGWFDELGEESTNWLADLQQRVEDAEYEDGYAVQLSIEDMENLAYVEANLMLDVSDEDGEFYVELGYVQDIEWDEQSGMIVGLFNGTWPTLDKQMVCMYDQVLTPTHVRALIPVTVNGVEVYLLVRFDAEEPGGRVLGYTEGYDENGNPARGYELLKEGDNVIPIYELLYWDENNEQQSEPFEGDPILVGVDGSIDFCYAPVEDGDYLYGFCLNSIYGDAQFTDFLTISF